MEENKQMNSGEEEKFVQYFRRIREETKTVLQKKWDAKRYAASAGWLLAQFSMNKNPEYAEEAATYILAATYMVRGDKR